MKPTNRLTELAVRQAKTSEKQIKLTDGGGMYLVVTAIGSKRFQMNYRYDS